MKKRANVKTHNSSTKYHNETSLKVGKNYNEGSDLAKI